jgi:nicotinate dehydrogenase subunit B
LIRSRKRKLLAGGGIGIVGSVVIALGLLVATDRPALPDRAADVVPGLDRASVARGAGLARLGYCSVCHTATGSRAYAGSRPLRTPFGMVYSSNITPDASTGLGQWSRNAFRRAMRRGISRDGSYLYPAFPYDHYTHVSDRDLDDLQAFLTTLPPVRSTPPRNRLVFPLGFRPLLAGWDLLFLHPGPIAVDPARSVDWTRGRYLTEGLAHCGGCHTPRNVMGAEKRGRDEGGGWSDGWFAPPLEAHSPALRPWTVARLFAYLRTGLDRDHAAAAGPMGAVADQLSRAPEADVHAIAVYVASLMPRPSSDDALPGPDRADADRTRPAGAMLFAGACAACHGTGAPMMLVAGRPALGLGTPLHEDNPRDVIQIILQGLKPPVGPAGPVMPAFADSLTDAQVADLAGYLRARFDDHGPWPGDLRQAVQAARAASAP